METQQYLCRSDKAVVATLSLLKRRLRIRAGRLPRAFMADPVQTILSLGKGPTVEIDPRGVPITNYHGIIGKQRNPTVICEQAFKYEAALKEGNQASLAGFLTCATWLVNTARKYADYCLWEYHFCWPPYHMTPPWRSGMAQGLGLQVMRRAFSLTGDKVFIDTGRAALASFFVSVQDGGVTLKAGDGWWYEEYAHEYAHESRVLNGMMFALLGIYEWYAHFRDTDALLAFERGTEALKARLPDYDDGTWTYYDAARTYASLRYHGIHVWQLEQLYELTHDASYLGLARKWGAYRY